jgi:23S rRNA pseudouridine1911/1915/1917 synthase
MSEPEPHFFLEIPPQARGNRVDRTLADLLPQHTRNAIQGWIRQDLVLLDGVPVKSKFRLQGNETLQVTIPVAEPVDYLPQAIPLDILEQDSELIVINKPAGLVVHPGAGNQSGTLLNALLHHDPQLATLPRAGIVHRLDKDTTGLMVVARTEMSRQSLISQLEQRHMQRQYITLVEGIMISGETIDQPIGRHRNNRLKMTVTHSGKPAVTHLRVLEKHRMHTLIQANLESGRTHQIRVHLSWRGYSIVGDTLYGNRNRVPPAASEKLVSCLQGFHRQALHAQQLTLSHPSTDTDVTWACDPPEDFQELLTLVRDDSRITDADP